MAVIALDPLSFSGSKVSFKGYGVEWNKKELLSLLGSGEIRDNQWHCDFDEDKARAKLKHTLGVYLANHLRSITGRRLIWIFSPPIIGHTAFGLIDRGTNVIQVRPVSGCNLDCVFCSVDEGANSSSRMNDFVVDCDLLLSEFCKLASFKQNVEAHIDGEGEPSWYHDITKLVRGLESVDNVSIVSMQSNGTLLTKEKVKQLEEAGLTRINLSVHTLDDELARSLCGKHYNLDKVKSMAETIAKSKIELLIAPVWLPGINDDDIPELIKWGDSIGAKVAVQNLLHHKLGRNLKQTLPFPKFYEKLKEWEQDTGVKMMFGLKDMGIVKEKSLQKTMRKGDVVTAEVILPGRVKDSAIAVAHERLIQVIGTAPLGSRVKLKIVRDKHNIYLGTLFLSKRNPATYVAGRR